MDKKKYVLKVLDILKESLPLARGLMVLIKKVEVDEFFLDSLIHAFQVTIDQVKDKTIKTKLTKAKGLLKKLKEKESASEKMDKEEIQKLDDLLAKI